MRISIQAGRYLVHNSGCELELVGGPYPTQKKFEAAIIDTIGAVGYGEHDLLHILIVSKKGLSFSEFSGEFMDEMQERANEADKV